MCLCYISLIAAVTAAVPVDRTLVVPAGGWILGYQAAEAPARQIGCGSAAAFSFPFVLLFRNLFLRPHPSAFFIKKNPACGILRLRRVA